MTTPSPFLPGLLFRAGPSLFSPAMIYDGQHASFFSTNTLLDGFQPSPETGSLHVPFVESLFESRSMGVRPLGVAGLMDVRRTFETLVWEAGRLLGADQEQEVSSNESRLLLATEGEWTVGDYEGPKLACPEDLRSAEVSVTFSRRSGRFCRLSLHDDGGLSVAAGWRNERVHVFQEVSLGDGGHLAFGVYQFEFLDTAAPGLAVLTGQTSFSGEQLALDLGGRIYASGQYAPDQMGCALQFLGPKGKWRALRKRDGTWSWPSGIEPEDLNPVQVGTRNTVARRDSSRIRLPLAETYWERNDLGNGHLLVRLHALPGKPLPLHPTLHEVLWDGARKLLFERAC